MSNAQEPGVSRFVFKCSLATHRLCELGVASPSELRGGWVGAGRGASLAGLLEGPARGGVDGMCLALTFHHLFTAQIPAERVQEPGHVQEGDQV